MSAGEIDEYIEKYLSIFKKTEKYGNIIHEKYLSKHQKVPDKLIDKLIEMWKYQIKKWMRKRYVFNELFEGKCVACGDSNLTHLDLHYVIPELKNIIEGWQSIALLDCEEIMRLIMKEKCISLCSN